MKLFSLFFALFFNQRGYSQSEYLRDYVIIAGDVNCLPILDCGVDIGTQVSIDTGIIGSFVNLIINIIAFSRPFLGLFV